MNKKKMAAIALLPALGVAAFAGSVFAANSTSTGANSFIGNTMGKLGFRGSHDNTQYAADLASALGLTATDVKAKLDAGQTPDAIVTATRKTVADVSASLKTIHLAALKTKLDAQVTAGTITQAQADAKITEETKEPTEGLGFSGERGHDHGPRDNTMFAQDLSSVLGLSATDVKAKLDAGQTPNAIITAAGKVPADVMTQLHTAHEASEKAQIAADLASGKITQAQADAWLAKEANETPGDHHGDHSDNDIETDDDTTTSTQGNHSDNDAETNDDTTTSTQ